MSDNVGMIATIDSMSVLRELMDEREQRYNERHEASQLAITVAFAAQEKAITAALLAAEKAVAAALASAERAVLKAEAAAERRFEGVNEFRQALSDQAIQLITRTEVGARLDALSAKIDMGLTGVSKETNITVSRIDRMEGKQGPRTEADNRVANHESQIAEAASRITRIEAKSGGMGSLASAVAVGIGVLISIVSAVVLLAKP